MKPLPIGIQTFSKIIDGNYLYIDKTRHIYNLIKNSTGVYFLSRPRRFGKSLLLSVLDEIFQGNKELFKGLWLYEAEYNWKKHPVIRLDFSKQKAQTTEKLIEFIDNQLGYIAEKYSFTFTKNEYYEKFEELMKGLGNQEPVVILMDEYDKAIIDHLEDVEKAKEMREVMKGFFTVLKGNDSYIRFLLLTGVSKFSKAGVFSNLNHLEDLTIDNQASSLLGITEEELNEYFQDYIIEFSKDENITREELIDKIRFWYNGYCFSGKGVSVYNPFSTLLLFKKRAFQNHWFETGTPTFLVELIKSKQYEIHSIPVQVQEISFSTYEIEYLEILPLLVQTGYLTIKGYNPEKRLYTLDYPNFEIKESFTSYLMKGFTKRTLSDSLLYDMIEALEENELDKYFEVLKGIFARIEYDLHLPYEKYYQTIFYLVFTLIGLKVQAEIKTNIGRIDAVIVDKNTYIFEFKFTDVSTLPKDKKRRKNVVARQALKQIKDKKYYERFVHPEKQVSLQTNLKNPIPKVPSFSSGKIYLVGAEFIDKNIGDYVMEELKV